MSDVKIEVKITAIAEVRDKDGNLVSSSPVELTGHLTEDEYLELESQHREAQK